ncbi:MAG: 3-phosphoshikimate 1-carboxyvinyltransferase [Verrucomicrobiota bacterium]
MPLPDLIEIVPLNSVVSAHISIPGSKSLTNRALILAALSEGEITLTGALWSDDTQVMVTALTQLGFDVRIAPDDLEPCNRTLRVRGLGGKIPNGGTPENPLDLFVGNAGTAARFLAPLVCLGRGVYRLHGDDRMHQRPQAALFAALRQLGCRIDSPNDRLPALFFGAGPRQAACQVNVGESSQFASALLLCATVAPWRVDLAPTQPEPPYVAMTRQLIAAFPRRGGAFQIEPDASSASYFVAAQWLLNQPSRPDAARIAIAAYPASGWQIDSAFPKFLPLPARISRRTQLGDSIMTAIIVAPFASRPTEFTDLLPLRLQECERVAALRSELAKCGATVIESGDTLTVHPSAAALHGAEIETYNDHRMALCFAILGLKIPGIRIKNPSCVKKTFPNFFQKLARRPPAGLGAAILDAPSRLPLREDQLLPPSDF